MHLASFLSLALTLIFPACSLLSSESHAETFLPSMAVAPGNSERPSPARGVASSILASKRGKSIPVVQLPDVVRAGLGCQTDVLPMEEWCRSGSLLATEVDLDGDGMSELFLDGSANLWFSGSNGFSTFLFRKVDARYQLVQDFFGSSVIVLEKTSNGHLDLVQACTPCDSNSATDEMSYVRYRWNGENYEVITRHGTKEM